MPDRPGFRAGIETALHGSGLPYGFTLTVWATGQALISNEGPPGLGPALLFAAGAAAAWGLLRTISRGASRNEGLQLSASPNLLRAGATHMVAIAAAICSAALVAELLDGTVVWPLGGFAATLVYLATTAVELWRRERENAGDDDG